MDKLIRRIRPVLATLLVLFLAQPVAADTLDVVEVRNRPAAELVDTLRGSARGDVSIVANGQQLILRGPADEVERLADLVARLDTPVEQLRITVRTERGGQTVQRGAELPGSSGARGDVRIYSSRRADERDSVQQLMVRSGQPAHISIGQQVPRSDEILILGADGVAYARRTRLQDIDRGFYALPRVQGENVTVELATHREHLRSDGSVDRAELVTEVTGAIGEWILVGRTAGADDRSEHSTRYTTRRRGNEDMAWWMRIERR